MPKHLVNAALGLFLCLWGAPALAAVANQSCKPTIGSTTGQHFGASTSFSFTNVTVSAGSNLALTVQVLFDTNSTPTVSSIVWDQAGANQSLAQINAGTSNAGNIETWALINPTPGTNKTVTINISASNAIYAVACAWTGVDQTGGATSFPHTQTQVNVSSVTITSETGNMVLSAGGAGINVGTPTGTSIFVDNVNGGVINAYANFDNGAASVVIGESANAQFVTSATDIQAAAGGGGGCTRHSLALTGAGC